MKIILITYPVSPYRGSEFAVSWNYIINMFKYWTNRSKIFNEVYEKAILKYKI